MPPLCLSHTSLSLPRLAEDVVAAGFPGEQSPRGQDLDCGSQCGTAAGE